jgi:hypothetical protein
MLRHALPPHMSWRLWPRHAHCVRFTSLRDMSLRRNRPVARSIRAPAWLQSIQALMLDLLA